MGSGISKALVKPGDCSNEVWKKILQLFDKLDTDGTHSIDDDELMGHIATLHVDNNIARLKDTKRLFNNNIEFDWLHTLLYCSYATVNHNLERTPSTASSVHPCFTLVNKYQSIS